MVWLAVSLELYLQGIGRLFRQGQRHGVIVHHLLSSGTIDEEVMHALGRKERRQEALLEALRLRAQRLSA